VSGCLPDMRQVPSPVIFDTLDLADLAICASADSRYLTHVLMFREMRASDEHSAHWRQLITARTLLLKKQSP
jgi:hypothetical protein